MGTKNLRPDEIGTELRRQHFKDFNDDSDLFKDYCAIGSLMTHEGKCRKHLQTLDNTLRQGLPDLKKASVLKPLSGISDVKRLKGVNLSAKGTDIEAVVEEFRRWCEATDHKSA